jgi:hypothetical protein
VATVKIQVKYQRDEVKKGWLPTGDIITNIIRELGLPEDTTNIDNHSYRIRSVIADGVPIDIDIGTQNWSSQEHSEPVRVNLAFYDRSRHAVRRAVAIKHITGLILAELDIDKLRAKITELAALKKVEDAAIAEANLAKAVAGKNFNDLMAGMRAVAEASDCIVEIKEPWGWDENKTGRFIFHISAPDMIAVVTASVSSSGIEVSFQVSAPDAPAKVGELVRMLQEYRFDNRLPEPDRTAENHPEPRRTP